ncbi:hypothetical protein GCM10009754_08880 [Amycolatopsis minnesotensis]|uniref:Uncharacterized protein n=1 Tax=Amycolatopsis minnesotensis TaxID=337894 RepID=A0ABP5BFG8_9PSEU
MSTVTATVALPTGYVAERREQGKRMTFGPVLAAIGLGLVPATGVAAALLVLGHLDRIEMPPVPLLAIALGTIVVATVLAAAGRSPRPERVAGRTALWVGAALAEFFVVLFGLAAGWLFIGLYFGLVLAAPLLAVVYRRKFA